MIIRKISKQFPVIAWWSGGVTSAVTCYLCMLWFGAENVRVIFIGTKNEDDDTYRFLKDCENWYGKKIETIFSLEYETIQEVWYEHKSLNVAKGAKCSSVLKKEVREKWQRKNEFSYQAFGFDIDELQRAKDMKVNNASCKPIFPLISELLTKKDCIRIIKNANDLFVKIDIPNTYKLGFQNNNCFKTGCVKGGIGYWQKMLAEFPDKFDAMAKVEHELTDLKGKPVTMLKDQSNGGGVSFSKTTPKLSWLKRYINDERAAG